MTVSLAQPLDRLEGSLRGVSALSPSALNRKVQLEKLRVKPSTCDISQSLCSPLELSSGKRVAHSPRTIPPLSIGCKLPSPAEESIPGLDLDLTRKKTALSRLDTAQQAPKLEPPRTKVKGSKSPSKPALSPIPPPRKVAPPAIPAPSLDGPIQISPVGSPISMISRRLLTPQSQNRGMSSPIIRNRKLSSPRSRTRSPTSPDGKGKKLHANIQTDLLVGPSTLASGESRMGLPGRPEPVQKSVDTSVAKQEAGILTELPKSPTDNTTTSGNFKGPPSFDARVIKDCLMFLSDASQCNLFQPRGTLYYKLHVTRETVKKLFETCGAGAMTLHIIKSINLRGLVFYSLEELAARIKQENEDNAPHAFDPARGTPGPS